MRGIFIFWLVALVSAINNVLVEYRESRGLFENPQSLAGLTISIYLATTAIFAFITFNRALNYKLRAGLLLFNLYMLGTTGMVLTSFSGDGRILLFAFVIFSGVFYEFRYSLIAFLVALFTLGMIGYLQVSELLVVPSKLQVNAALPGAWISGGLVWVFLSIATLISINYLLRALEGSLAESRKTLQREQHLSQILRTVSEVNRLIVRAQDQESLLMEACKLLISDRGYAFAWVGLLKGDGTSLEFTACAGDHEAEKTLKTHLGREIQPPVCVESAIHSKTYYYVNPGDSDDPCRTCPRKGKYPNRSAVALPLLYNERVLGSLVVDYDEESKKFDEQEITLLQELAGNLAYALENIKASKQLNMYASRQKLLNDVTQSALGAPNLDSLLRDFIGKLEEAMDADGYYFVLWDETRQFPSKFVSSDNL
ncbi:MAG: GAF domain-containing protein, partial [Chloroflexi bacterium]|nr:GAF domain-containing protein [Chloroflexota bacterium]